MRIQEHLFFVSWKKSFKNGIKQIRSQDIITCLDAGASSEGAIIDGIPFIPPIRRAVTRFERDETTDEFKSPFEYGDSLYVQKGYVARL